VLSSSFGGSHTGGYALTDERGLQLRHGGDDGEHRSAHGTAGVDLILDADETHAEMIEFLKRQQQVTSAPGERV